MQPKSKQNHSHTPSQETYTSNLPSTGLVSRSPSRKQILTPKANAEQNWAFNNYTSFKKWCKGNSQRHTKHNPLKLPSFE